jgi:hypothetical protein
MGGWSQKSERKAISVTVSHVQKLSVCRSRSWDFLLPDVEIYYLGSRDSLFLTNTNAYIRCKVEELSSNPANWHEGLVLASGATS